MDLVKSHLLYAVREEMLELKEKIKLLTEENNKLKRENNALRQTQQTQVHQHTHATSTQVKHHSPARSEQQQQYTEVSNQASKQIVQQSTTIHQSQMGLQQGAMHTSLVTQQTQQLSKQMQTPYPMNPQIPQQQNQLPQITPDQPTYNQYQSVPRQDSAGFQVAQGTSNLRQDASSSNQLQQRQDQMHYQQVTQQQTQQAHKP
ncbi:probable serine/threonine-protein kinase irlF [Anneissia japonica]|uniref:probable serine/threonine-protein kinase irlF n=1 Tax=Anneissia japonica TaxID=1529436 RepID=UPI0014257B2F|nr:probable serine/threonine-protein kinase irlF [Anneissia japonica]